MRPKTGDVFLADLEPVKGSEQGRERPVIVFQNPDLGRFTSTLICIPLTTNLSRRGLPGTSFIKKSKQNGLSQDSIGLCFQLRAIDKSRLTKRYGTLNPETLNAIAESVLSALGIDLG
ncbi:MAG: type II toxin-antitoxin system PemK/MazF family toxin [Nitrospirae bacterium]|nr:type II toxin-antitoxin system PemK/MazF family toxin [Nitrospirota bacterium]MBI3352788.1 type II toxin-antitoxin system PemK/MazF family toxin [Nitrospirota bacterium]